MENATTTPPNWSRSKIIVIVLILVCVSAAVIVLGSYEQVLRARREEANYTMGVLVQLGIAIDLYKLDNGHVPVASDIEELNEKLYPKYRDQVFIKDAWDNRLEYKTYGDTYYIASTGKDGKIDQSFDLIKRDTKIRKVTNDIVYSNGSFIQYPDREHYR